MALTLPPPPTPTPIPYFITLPPPPHHPITTHVQTTPAPPRPAPTPSPPGELDVSKVPFWEFTGEYMHKPEGEAGVPAAKINGKSFCPWQFPEIHERL